MLSYGCILFGGFVFQNLEPGTFNTFLTEIKVTLKDKGRKDFWEEVVSGENKNTESVLS